MIWIRAFCAFSLGAASIFIGQCWNVRPQRSINSGLRWKNIHNSVATPQKPFQNHYSQCRNCLQFGQNLDKAWQVEKIDSLNYLRIFVFFFWCKTLEISPTETFTVRGNRERINKIVLKSVYATVGGIQCVFCSYTVNPRYNDSICSQRCCH